MRQADLGAQKSNALVVERFLLVVAEKPACILPKLHVDHGGVRGRCDGLEGGFIRRTNVSVLIAVRVEAFILRTNVFLLLAVLVWRRASRAASSGAVWGRDVVVDLKREGKRLALCPPAPGLPAEQTWNAVDSGMLCVQRAGQLS